MKGRGDNLIYNIVDIQPTQNSLTRKQTLCLRLQYSGMNREPGYKNYISRALISGDIKLSHPTCHPTCHPTGPVVQRRLSSFEVIRSTSFHRRTVEIGWEAHTIMSVFMLNALGFCSNCNKCPKFASHLGIFSRLNCFLFSQHLGLSIDITRLSRVLVEVNLIYH